jgi:hypothetical protein
MLFLPSSGPAATEMLQTIRMWRLGSLWGCAALVVWAGRHAIIWSVRAAAAALLRVPV